MTNELQRFERAVLEVISDNSTATGQRAFTHQDLLELEAVLRQFFNEKSGADASGRPAKMILNVAFKDVGVSLERIFREHIDFNNQAAVTTPCLFDGRVATIDEVTQAACQRADVEGNNGWRRVVELMIGERGLVTRTRCYKSGHEGFALTTVGQQYMQQMMSNFGRRSRGSGVRRSGPVQMMG